MKNNVRSYLRSKFFPEKTMTEEDYTRGRRLFLVEGAATQGINSMTTGVIISGFLKFLGVTDVINGIISGHSRLRGYSAAFFSRGVSPDETGKIGCDAAGAVSSPALRGYAVGPAFYFGYGG